MRPIFSFRFDTVSVHDILRSSTDDIKLQITDAVDRTLNDGLR